jgi:hypothetical protein
LQNSYKEMPQLFTKLFSLCEDKRRRVPGIAHAVSRRGHRAAGGATGSTSDKRSQAERGTARCAPGKEHDGGAGRDRILFFSARRSFSFLSLISLI